MLGHRWPRSLLIGAVLASAAFLPARAQVSITTEERDDSPRLSLPSRVSFQAEPLRHRSEAQVPASFARKDEARALWLARLAAEGRRPVRLAWRPASDGQTATDRFARLSLDVKGAPTLLPLHVAEPERWTRVMESLVASSSCPCTHWGAIPGRVPDGDVLRGPVLRAGKSGGNLVLSWGGSCSSSANDYTVHQGTLGTWYSHQAVACTTGGVTSTTLAPGSGSRYFLVVPVTDDAEGSYGSDSAGRERPNSPVGCRGTWVTQHCP